MVLRLRRPRRLPVRVGDAAEQYWGDVSRTIRGSVGLRSVAQKNIMSYLVSNDLRCVGNKCSYDILLDTLSKI